MMESDKELLIRIDERVTTIMEDMKILNKTLHGNGAEGLCERVKRNEIRIEEINVNNDKKIKNIQLLITLTSVIIITAIAILNYLRI